MYREYTETEDADVRALRFVSNAWHPRETAVPRFSQKESLSRKNARINSSPHSVPMDSGWYCTPHQGFSRWRIPIIIPSSVQASASNVDGSGSRTAKEWYLITSAPLGTSRKIPVSTWRSTLVRPCMGVGAGPTRPPQRSAISWCPRHTPRVGTERDARASGQMPTSLARAGCPGPGEITRERIGRLRSSSTVIPSLFTTWISSPRNRAICWYRLKVNESWLSKSKITGTAMMPIHSLGATVDSP